MPIRGERNRAHISAINYEVEGGKIEVTRTLRVVPGETSRLRDTVLIQYAIKNTGDVRCAVGLRTHLDTCIGTTDAVPFYVPPMNGQPGGLVHDRAVFEGEEVPDFILARELDDLKDPNNTHVVLGLRFVGWEEPSRLILCHRDRSLDGPPAPEEEPGVSIQWPVTNMHPGERRGFGYTYGLGQLEDEESPCDPHIALQFVRSSHWGKPFPVVAHLRGAKNQTVTLTLPEGAELLPGETAEKKLDASGGRNAVVWRVVATKPGIHQFAVAAPGVGTAKGTIEVPPGCNFGL